MFVYETKLAVNAKPEIIWETLIAFSEYSKWNPYIYEVKGNAELDAKLVMSLQLDQGPFLAKPRIYRFEENKAIGWRSRLYLPKLYDSEHVFEIEPLGKHQSTVRQTQTISGILVKGLIQKLGDDTKKAMDELMRGLKKECNKR